MVATWGCFLLFILVSPLTGISEAVHAYIMGPTWVLAVFLLGPLMAVMAVNFAIYVSSRAADPRVAEQISAVLILPVMMVLFGQIAGIVTLDLKLVLITAVVLLLLDIGLVWLAARLFKRENILTAWK